MPYVLGVDIGSSFISASVSRVGEGGHRPLPHPVQLASHSNAVPTVVHIAEDASVLVGDAAEQAGLSRPELVVREFCERIGDPIPLHIGGLRVAPEDVFATVVRWVLDRTEQQQGAPPDAVTLTHPASWGAYKVELVHRALDRVGLAGVTLLSEPQAAARNYAGMHPENADEPMAVYDLGGSTFQLSIIRGTGSGGFEVIGSPAIERLGGDDFDDLVVARVAARIGDAFHHNDSGDGGVRQALSLVREECLKAKEALSSSSEASVRVVLPGVRAAVRLVRPEFEDMIAGPLRETVDVLRESLAACGLAADDLASVLLIGGSSRIPLVAQMLAEELTIPIVTDRDPAGALAAGAALDAAERLARLREESVQTQAAEEHIESDRKRVVGARRISHGIGWSRLRPSKRAVTADGRGASVRAEAVPMAAAVAMVALIVTVVTAQTTGLGARIAQAGDPVGESAGDPFLPESLRGEGDGLGLPFALMYSGTDEPVDADATPFVALPPPARATDRAPAPGGSQSRAPQQSAPGGSKAPSGSTTGAGAPPDQGTDSSQGPPIEPVPSEPVAPEPAPVPVPDPDPDPAPVPDPDPDPVPDPAPDTDPVPEPAPEPLPDPAPEPTVEPEPGTEV